MRYLFSRVVIVGVGLIGSSIGVNLVRRRMAREVIGVGRDRRNLQEALRRKAIDRFVVGARQAAPLLAGLTKDDLVILATPVRSILHYLRVLPRGVLITDVGSTKESILRVAARRRLRFVGSHPIAGTEKSGSTAGETSLFQKRFCLVVPLPHSGRSDVKRVQSLWKALGGHPVLIPAERHDRLLAAVSHLPHAVAFALVGAVQRLVSNRERQYGLGGLRDMTRVVLSPPPLWGDIFMENRPPVLKSLRVFLKELTHFSRLVERRDEKGLRRFLWKAHAARRNLS